MLEVHTEATLGDAKLSTPEASIDREVPISTRDAPRLEHASEQGEVEEMNIDSSRESFSPVPG